MPSLGNLFKRMRNAALRPLIMGLDTLQGRLLAQGAALDAQQVVLRSQHDLILRGQAATALEQSRNPLNRYGAKYFSQTDEDGITLEIMRRLGVDGGVFCEIGVGDGLQNNSLILLAHGWKGFWIGGEDLAFDANVNPARLAFLQAWISLKNLAALLNEGCERIGAKELDLLSLDVDGNDYYFAETILSMGILPKVFIFEYNAKFPPAVKWSVEYDADHRWDCTDYQGASLGLFVELLQRYSYTLICCNAHSGANAFFVRNEFLHLFPDAPKDIDDIFVGPRYNLYQNWAHPTSPKTVEQLLKSDRAWQKPVSELL